MAYIGCPSRSGLARLTCLHSRRNKRRLKSPQSCLRIVSISSWPISSSGSLSKSRYIHNTVLPPTQFDMVVANLQQHDSLFSEDNGAVQLKIQYHEVSSNSSLKSLKASVDDIVSKYSSAEVMPSSTNDSSMLLVNFENQQEAELAEQEIQKLTKRSDSGLASILLSYSSISHPGNVYIRGIHDAVEDLELFEIFEPYGEILSCKIIRDNYGKSKGYGFINFSNGISATNAIKGINGKSYANGSKLYLNRHISKKERLKREKFEQVNFKNLYIKNIPSLKDESKILSLFEQYGEIDSYFLPKNQSHLRGYGFVKYVNHEDAFQAMEGLQKVEVDGHVMSISRAQKKQERMLHEEFEYVPYYPMMNSGIYPIQYHQQAPLRYQDTNLYLNNLASDVNDDTLDEIFLPFGEIISARVMTEENGSSRGFGFVCFSNISEATAALVEMNEKTVNGLKIQVSFAQRKERKKSFEQPIMPPQNPMLLHLAQMPPPLVPAYPGFASGYDKQVQLPYYPGYYQQQQYPPNYGLILYEIVVLLNSGQPADHLMLVFLEAKVSQIHNADNLAAEAQEVLNYERKKNNYEDLKMIASWSDENELANSIMKVVNNE